MTRPSAWAGTPVTLLHMGCKVLQGATTGASESAATFAVVDDIVL